MEQTTQQTEDKKKPKVDKEAIKAQDDKKKAALSEGKIIRKW